MNAQFTYFLILAAALAGPLALSFDKKVAFYKSWKYVFPAMIIPAILYIAWDIYFTSVGVWSFNENYVTGLHLVNLPVEEVLFFFVVPYCCLFIYACIRTYFPNLQPAGFTRASWWLLAFLLIAAGIFFNQRYYTSWAFVFCGLFMVAIGAAPKWFPGFNLAAFFVSYLLILLPFLLVNGFLTALPVVFYNDAENLGVRIHTIPFEDVFYGMLLILMNVTIYERLRVPFST